MVDFPLLLRICISSHHLHCFPTRRSSDLSRKRKLMVCRIIRYSLVRCIPICLISPVRVNYWLNRIISIRNLPRSEEHTSELQSRENLVCRLLREKKNCSQTLIV